MKKKNKKLIAARQADEAAVIQHCMAAAMAVARTHAAFSIDPDPNGKAAKAIGDPADRKADREVRAVAALPVATRAAVRAQARLALVLIKDDDGCIREELALFFRNFATCVDTYCRQMERAEWLAGKKAA